MMNTLTVDHHGKTVRCRWGATGNWSLGRVNVSDGHIRIFINWIAHPLHAFTEYELLDKK